MNKLIIKASPASTSFTHEIAKIYEKGSKEVGDKVEVLDLYDEKLFQSLLKFEDKKEFGKDENRKTIQGKMSWADEIIFIFPIWWGGIPGILKNFFDTNFES
jgi:NAD(P)H dehydrogenase (quinone)